jgi:hypothetical protein
MENESQSEFIPMDLDEYLERSKDLFASLDFLDFFDPIEPYFNKGSKQQYIAILWLLRVLFLLILVGCFWLLFFGKEYDFLHQLAINISAGMIAFMFAQPIRGSLRKWGIWFLVVPTSVIFALFLISSNLRGSFSDLLQNLACDLCLVVALDLIFQKFINDLKSKFGKRI